jgi:hypothetical protein
MGKPPRGTAPRIRKDVRLDPDLLAEIEAIVAADPTVTLTAILEDGARLWLARYRRQKGKEKIDT